MLIEQLGDPVNYKYKWRSPYDFNNTFSVPHIYALVYEGKIKYIGQSNGSRPNYYTGGVIPRKIKQLGIKGVIEFCSTDQLNKKEIYWISKVKPIFNISSGGSDGLYGNKNPAKRIEVRQKISEYQKGRKLTEQHRNKLKQAKLDRPVKYWKGKKRDKTTIDKIKLALEVKNKQKYQEIVKLIKKGYLTREIVEKLKVSTSTIAKARKKEGISRRHARPRRSSLKST